MKSTARAATTLAGWLCLVLGTALGQETPPSLTAEKLPNGLEVTVFHDPALPLAATQLWYHLGSANEEPRTRGFAHLFEHLMFGGTAAHSKQEFWQFHHRYGGENNAYTSFDETVYTSAINPAGLDQVLDLEADRMTGLLLTAENLDNEKRIVTEELRQAVENDPYSRLAVKALKALLGEHPYALTPVGTKEDIAAATLDHAREFYARFYRPNNAHLVVAGPNDPAAVLARVREAFGGIPAGGGTPPDVPEVLAWPLPGRLDLREDIPPVEVAVLGFPLPPAGAPDQPALEVLKQLLAGGQVNQAEEELVVRRRRALAAGMQWFQMRRGGGLALYAANLPHRSRASAFRDLQATLEKLGKFDWLSPGALAAAKRTLQRRAWQQVYFAEARAEAIGRARWHEGDAARALDRPARIEAVTEAEVRAAFNRYFTGGKPVQIFIRPEKVPLWLRLFGWLAPLVVR